MTARWSALLLTATLAQASHAATAAEVRLAVHGTATLALAGANTAFAVDPSLVDVTVAAGQVSFTGRRAGQTLVTVVTASSLETITVHVDPAPSPLAAAGRAAGDLSGEAMTSYDSGARRWSTGATARFGARPRETSVQFLAVRENPVAGAPPRWALPNASIELNRPGVRTVLLDERIEGAPLTLGGTVVRGVHLHSARWELHAGVSSSTPWNDILLPREGDRALGLTYRTGNDDLRLLPSVVWLPDADGSQHGAAVLGLERGAPDGPVRLKAELGWSGVPGASVDLTVRRPERQLWLQAAARPAAFAALEAARPPGRNLDGAWTEALGQHSSASVTISANRLDLAGQQPQSATGRLELRRELGARWSVTASAGASSYQNLDLAAVHQRNAGLGAAYDTSGFGASVLLRHQPTSVAPGSGQGARFTLRASRPQWRASAYADVQQQAPTLDLIFEQRPDLARAFTELGIVASTPQDVLNQLRDHADLLAEHGVTLGAIRLAALQRKAGLELAWQGSGPRRLRLNLRALADERRGGSATSLSTLTGASASWHVFGDTELSLGYSRWNIRRAGIATSNGAFQFTLRTRLTREKLARWMPGSGAAISGQVLRDDSAGGGAVAPVPLADVVVTLDGQRQTVTDAAGRFEFGAPGRGEHRVSAALPAAPGAYFTAPSTVQLPAGGAARFTISFAAARLSGTVRSDAGLPLNGVTLQVTGTAARSAVTDTDGIYRFAVPPGPATVAVVADSVPPGYDLGGLVPQQRTLAADQPAVADFTLRAQRALKGTVRWAGGGVLTLAVPELGRKVTLDKSGGFLLRSLPAGPLTLIASDGNAEARQTVTLPPGPGTVSGIELKLPPPAPRP